MNVSGPQSLFRETTESVLSRNGAVPPAMTRLFG